MDLWRFDCLGIIFRDVAFGEERPAHEVFSLDCPEPSGFYGVAAHGMHPLDCLFGGWEVVNAAGLLQLLLGLLGRFARLPLPSLLYQWNAIASSLIAFPNGDRSAFICDQHILLFVDYHAVFGEDRNITVIHSLSNAH